MQIELGTRVVRGVDWIWNEQDGEEGMLGTVIQIKSEVASMSSVKVLWDHGGQGIYRSGENNSCDLLVFCSPAVSKHGVGCDVCLKDVIGTRWCCKECPLTNICTSCYMNDKHSLQHAFERFDSSENNGTQLPPRAISPKVEAKGFFPGAMVVRGLCWEWEDQDGGDGQIGKVTEIQEFHSKYRRNVARVQWLGNGVSNVYRIGHNGKVDLKCIKPAPGGFYYKKHLPMLGEKSETMSHTAQPTSIMRTAAIVPNFPMEDGASSSIAGATSVAGAGAASLDIASSKSIYTGGNNDSLNSADSISSQDGNTFCTTAAMAAQGQNQNVGKQFQINDRVRIAATRENCIALQAGHGGWNAKMEAEIGKIGVVDAITEKGDVSIAMEDSDSKWILNPQILEKLVAPKLLKDGDSIKILSNLNIAKKLYVSKVGEWTEEITSCLGQVGKITKVFLDGNMRVVFGQSLVVIPSEFVVEKIQQINPAEAEVSEAPQEIKIVQAAKAGDLQELKDILDSSSQNVNTPSLESTPLTAAIFEEREDVIAYLLKKGADVNILDKSKHTALHHALSVGNEDIINLVISDKRLDTNILAGKSSLDYLQFASVCGSTLGVKYLLQNTPIRMARTGSGPSPVHFAVFSNNDLVKYLINEAGYDINSRDLERRTPLQIAILTSNLSAAMFLIEYGADVNASDIRGNTALHMTMSLQDRVSLREHAWYAFPIKRYIGKKDQQRTENKETIKKLVIDLEMRKTWYANDSVISCFLIKHGADVTMKNSSGSTPFTACTRTEVLAAVKKFHDRFSRKVTHILPTTDIAKAPPQADRYSSLSSDGSTGFQECRLCRDNNADATFEPCSHSVVCLDCASYFCKCFMCEKEVISFSKRSTTSECLVCDENVADVIFEPCKHVVCCSSCAWRMAKCIFCKMEINMKFDRNLQPLAAPNDADNAKYDDLLSSLKSLEAKVKEIESVNTCTICLDRQRNVMFLCGHGTCDICSPTLELCPICRDPIEKKIPVF